MDIALRVRTAAFVAGVCTLALILVTDSSIIPLRAQAQSPDASCVSPAPYTRSVVSVAWHFDKARAGANGREIVGLRATAWFYTSPRLLVTAAHFANELPAHNWQEVDLLRSTREGSPVEMIRVQVRVTHQGNLSDSDTDQAEAVRQHSEDLAIIELRDPVPGAQTLEVRAEPPSQGETVLILGYPEGRLRSTNGTVRRTNVPVSKYDGLALLEVAGSNRLLLNGGASGAPVLDCQDGRVVAVLNGLLTLPPPGNSALPTPSGSPTNTAVPASVLNSIVTTNL